MSTVAIRHEESWHVQVTRDEGDDWPDMEGRRHTRSQKRWRPDTVRFSMHRNSQQWTVTVAGLVYNQDGRAGKVGIHDSWYSRSGLPEWVEEIVTKARETNGLRPAETGVDW